MIERLIAVYRVYRGQAQRICKPGRWIVCRDGDRVIVKVPS